MSTSTPKDESQRHHPTAARWLTVGGWLLFASGVLHIFVMLWQGGSWEGAVSWRKPILFGISTGITMVSIGWVLSQIRSTVYDRWINPVVSIALVIEVGLITLQQWRGVASHFNQSTEFNFWIDQSIGYLITVAAAYILLVTWRCFGTVSVQRDVAFAIRAGMLFLSFSCLIGFVILFAGQSQLAANSDPETIGKAGVLKFPHGFAIHAIQLLPILCWVMSQIGIPIERSFRVIRYTTASIGCGLVFAIVQTVEGRARFDLTPGSGILLAISIALIAPLFIEFVAALKKKPTSAS